MYCCVFCGCPVGQLYKSYGGGSISLVSCPQCKQVADPYVEYDWVLKLLDLALLKPAMFKHVLWNEAVDTLLLGRFFAFLLIVDCFVRVSHRDFVTAPMELLEIGELKESRG
jgi:hypothetical protein